jgi:hypothetical protein
MKIVVVAGQGRKVGKTAVMAGLIRGLRSLGWTTVKISTHRGRLPHTGEKLRRRSSLGRHFVLTEERKPLGEGDTGRYLAAGATRALWLRTRWQSLPEALPALLRRLKGDRFVMIESNSVLGLLAPTVALFVRDRNVRAFKLSAQKALARADAIVTVEAPTAPQGRPSPGEVTGVPVFTVARPDCSNRELCRFVRRKLRSAPRPEPGR